MTVDELLEKFGTLMFEAGMARGELSVVMRMSKDFSGLPDAPAKVHLIKSDKPDKKSLTPLKDKKEERGITPYKKIITKIINSFDRAVNTGEILRIAKQEYPQYQFTKHDIGSILNNMLKTREVLRPERGMYQRMEQSTDGKGPTLEPGGDSG